MLRAEKEKELQPELQLSSPRLGPARMSEIFSSPDQLLRNDDSESREQSPGRRAPVLSKMSDEAGQKLVLNHAKYKERWSIPP